MKTLKYFFLAALVSIFLLTALSLFAQPAPQTAGGLSQQEESAETTKKLEERITTKRKKFKEAGPEQMAEEDVGPKARVNTITVEGVVLLPAETINMITSRYEGKDLSLRTMQKIADLITDEYRKAGYATSRAYLPPQSTRISKLPSWID